ncbi:glycosyltransferase family 4 protein [Phenylobacterium sp.]|uniref:glycosyltransferase family 4 protein n=1 Tax=Phenylobacterium sp. TaxID=1871053 RepID=UPI002E360913|nr:glycosyltransferase family 4 protein [Phenylobacterium sp.]HEX3366183.1 glycosyltransferase family 4 protein [Phenylobacterium sp.]
MADRLALYHPRGVQGLGKDIFGKDVANLELMQAMARHGGFSQVEFLSAEIATEAQARQLLLDDPAAAVRVTPGSMLSNRPMRAAGAVLRGQPGLQNLAWLRRLTGNDRDLSLIGLVHTLAPPAIRQSIAMASVSPVYPWDAIICTSPSVRDAVSEMFDEWGEFLAERTGGSPPPRAALPVIPLGVDAARFAAMADRPEARARVRARLGLGEDDALMLWVGRLSFFEKAYPQPMFKAAQLAARGSGAPVPLHFAMAGWFPGDKDRGRFEAAAKAHAPDVPVHFLDGNDRELLSELWAGADIFISLVDNVQETFGITPIEAMAAGLPVVASDWDGYRSTVRHGVDGFLIPTLGGPRSGLGVTIVQRHLFELTTYQTYVGEIAQYTPVHIGSAAAALAELGRSPELRRKMGAAGRERVAAAFDWPIVARQISGLVDEMAAVRAASPDPPRRVKADPVRPDPFVSFAGFPTQLFTLDMPIAAVPGVNGKDVLGLSLALDTAFAALRSPLEECAQALDLLASGQARTGREVLSAFPMERRRMLEMGLVWMAKLGMIDWLP